MKRNALIRIILWSLIIVLLLSVMFSVLFNWRKNHAAPLEEEIASTLVTAPTVYGSERNAMVTDNLNIRIAPSTEADVAGMLVTGESIHISRRETVNGQEWAFITFPTTGWILAEYTVDVLPNETVYIANVYEKDTFSASEISKLEIEWVAGEILIQTSDSDQIKVREDGFTDEKYAMVMKHTGNTLKIQFCEEGIASYFGVNTRTDLTKDLTITVPRDWICESLEIECASATVEVNDLTIREVEFDGASGTCKFENCTVDEMDIDTTSGDIRFIGSLNILDCDAASASIYAVLSNTPSRLDMDTMSGDLDITLPADAGFTVTMDGMSSDFSSDFETTIKNGNQVCGDGRCRISIDAMSGDVTIRKGETPAAS